MPNTQPPTESDFKDVIDEPTNASPGRVKDDLADLKITRIKTYKGRMVVVVTAGW